MPELEPGQVLVNVMAAGINYMMRNNEHPNGNMAMIVNAPALGMTDLPL